ncbi:MAG: ABC transporter substrate-binding protein [Deltaproteobacteria bacterium]|nr:MAG: ABC transporter substrate-binding protein [Deltaproteobacteria bacterium]
MTYKNTGKQKGNHVYSRREFIKVGAFTGATAGALSISGLAPAQAAVKSKGLSLSMAGYNFDRTRALIDGRVKIEGCDTQFQEIGIGDINTNLFSGPQTLDVTEIGLHPFMLAYANDGFRDYSLLPIFPLRMFRHKSVFIRTDRNINKPEDLRGKKITTAGYSSTSLTWIRGIFQDEYGLKPEDMKWVVSQKDSSAKDSGKVSKQENIFPEGVPISKGPEGKDESDLLADGDVDATFHAAEPRAYIEGHPKVARLFPDYRSTERAYFSKTGIFPIMHAVAIKKTLAKQNPWLVAAVFKAYSQAKRLDFAYMANAAWAYGSLPWFGQEFDETRALMGDNYYSYGIKPNRKALESLFRYSHQQGLCRRQLTIAEVFEPASLGLVESFQQGGKNRG